jgi:thiamine biosynthesis protein ThiS
MNIIINGTSRQIASAINLSGLVQTFCPQPRHVITELNGVIIPHDLRSGTPIKEGDVLELVAFVGGG